MVPAYLNGAQNTTPAVSDVFPLYTPPVGWQSVVASALATFVLAQPAVTQSQGNNSTSVATTAYVDAAVAGGPALAGPILAVVPEVAQASTSTTPSDITGLTATLTAGRTYAGRLVVFCDDSVAAEGVRFDFDGGTATWTMFRASIAVATGATISVPTGTAIATDLIATSMGDTAVKCFVIEFAGVVNAGGTLVPRFGQSTHSSGTVSVQPGSYLVVYRG